MNDHVEFLDEYALGSDERRFLTFVLDHEEYGIQILKVQEIRRTTSTTPIPGSPAYVRGVMNLRGAIVPVIDLRARFGMPRLERDQFSVVIVTEVGTRVVGLIVDAVNDVLHVPAADLTPPPVLGAGVDTSLVTAMAQAGDRLVLLLDLAAAIDEAALAM